MKTPLIIVSAPSGAGKSTLCYRALSDFPQLRTSISFTTRSPRDGEKNGDPYFFVSKDEFKVKVSEGFFIEWAEVHGNLYGTPKYQVDEAVEDGKFLIMDVDVQGARRFKEIYPGASSVFILPPSVEELRRRIELRDKGKTNNIDLRLENARIEMKEAKKFDFQVVNSELEQAYSDFKKVIEEIIR